MQHLLGQWKCVVFVRNRYSTSTGVVHYLLTSKSGRPGLGRDAQGRLIVLHHHGCRPTRFWSRRSRSTEVLLLVIETEGSELPFRPGMTPQPSI
jgi:hypothetical protein